MNNNISTIKAYKSRNDFLTTNKFHLWTVLGIIALGFLIYSNTLNSSFHLDDYFSIVDNVQIRDLNNFSKLQSWTTFINNRPFSNFTFAINYYLNNLNVTGYHIVNILIHILSALSVYWLVLLIFKTQVLQQNKVGKYSKLIALFSALIFLTHPLQTQAVTYIVQRMAALATLFYLLSLCFYIKGRLLHTEEPDNKKKGYYYLAAVLAFLLAIASKETAFTMPITAVIMELFFIRNNNGKLYRNYIFSASIIIIVTVALRVLFYGLPREAATISRYDYLITQFKVIVTYIRLLILPINQAVDHDIHLSTSLTDFSTLASLIILITILVSSFLLYKNYRLLSFGILWFFITLSIESSIFPIADLIFEHRLYLPMFGYSLFLSSLLFQTADKLKPYRIVIILSVLVFVYSLITYQRNFVWETGTTLWSDNIKKTPNKARPYYFRGHFNSLAGNYVNSIRDYTDAIALDSNNALYYNDRGVSYNILGEYDKAISDFDKALSINSRLSVAALNRGNVYMQANKFYKAIDDFSYLLNITANKEKAYLSRGNAFASTKLYDKAIADFTKAIETAPTYVDAYLNRAVIYTVIGNYSKSIADYNHALLLAPNNLQALKNRGNVFFLQKNYQNAISDYSKAIEINSADGEIFYQRAIAYYYNNDGYKAWDDLIKALNLGYKVDPHQIELLQKKLTEH